MDYYFRMLENESEFNARYDYIQEANFGMTECQANLDAEDAYYEAETNIAMQDAMEARGGPLRWPIGPVLHIKIAPPTEEAG